MAKKSNNEIINKQTKKLLVSKVFNLTSELPVESTTQRFPTNTMFKVWRQSYSAHHHARWNNDATIHQEYGVQSQTSELLSTPSCSLKQRRNVHKEYGVQSHTSELISIPSEIITSKCALSILQFALENWNQINITMSVRRANSLQYILTFYC